MLQMILVRNQIRDILGGETDKITLRKFNINLRLRAKLTPVCVQNIGKFGGCGVHVCWYSVYDGICHAEGFGLLLEKCCDPIATLTPCKQKHPMKLSACINRTAVYA